MTDRRYIIVSGFHSTPHHGLEWFAGIWNDNLARYAKPQRVFIIADANCRISDPQGTWIVLSGDLGNCGDLLKGRKPHYLPGCPAVWMAGLWLAYINECDAICREQDCLCFGPWVEVIGIMVERQTDLGSLVSAYAPFFAGLVHA